MNAPSLLPNQRHLFDIPSHVTYLNCAYMSPLPRTVVEAGERAVRWKAAPWRITAEDFFTLPQHARQRIATLVGIPSPNAIAVIPAASYGLAVAAANLPLDPGEKIVLLEDQFPSNVYIWREKARLAQAHVHTVARPAWKADGAWPGWSQAVLDAIGPQTRIVAVPHCHWSDGGLLDLAAIAAQCRTHGAALVLDLSQSAGVLPIDMASIDPDFAVMVTYKWLMGPYGLGFLYIAPRWQQGQPLEQTWLGREGSEDFARLVHYRDTYAPGAERFDMGQRAQLQLMPMAIAGLDLLLSWQLPALYRTLTTVTTKLAAELATMGIRTLPSTQRAGHYLALQLPPHTPP